MSSRRAPITSELAAMVQRQQAAVADFDRELGRLLGVNDTDLRCLEILLEEVPEAAPSLLAERLGLTSGSVTTMLDRLELQGYLTRSPHPTDRRMSVVRASPTVAARAHELVGPLLDEGHRELLTHYTIEQLEVIIDFLRRDLDLQQRHTQRLRALPTPARIRTSRPGRYRRRREPTGTQERIAEARVEGSAPLDSAHTRDGATRSPGRPAASPGNEGVAHE